MPPFIKTANNVEFYHLPYKIGDFMHQKEILPIGRVTF
jgi:hypothetical protein